LRWAGSHCWPVLIACSGNTTLHIGGQAFPQCAPPCLLLNVNSYRLGGWVPPLFRWIFHLTAKLLSELICTGCHSISMNPMARCEREPCLRILQRYRGSGLQDGLRQGKREFLAQYYKLETKGRLKIGAKGDSGPGPRQGGRNGAFGTTEIYSKFGPILICKIFMQYGKTRSWEHTRPATRYLAAPWVGCSKSYLFNVTP
jgi:hypothetical protein